MKKYARKKAPRCPRCGGRISRRDEVAAAVAPVVAADRRRRSRRDWPGDRAGHRKAAKKGWARKKRASRAASTLARRRYR